jgi:Tol biopolymer transport system component
VGIVVATLATAVLGCPVSDAMTTVGTLVLSSGSGAPGVWVALRGRIPADTRTTVRLERFDDGGFVSVATMRTDVTGRFAFATRLPADRDTASYRVASAQGTTAVRTVVTGTTTRLTQDTDPTKEPIDRIGAGLVAVSGDGRFVYYSSQEVTYAWDRTSLTAAPVFEADSLHAGGISPSFDGRFLAYNTRSRECHREHPVGDVVVTDRTSGTTTPITTDDAGSVSPSISADGRRVSFQSCSQGLDGRDHNGDYDIFVGDTQSGQIDRITSGNDMSWEADLSADGRWVTFTSLASDLVAHDTNHHPDVFLGDSRTGKIRRVSEGDNVSSSPSVSSDGRFVVYMSTSYDAEHPYSSMADVYVWDRRTGRSTRVTPATDNTRSPQISDDGGHVVYTSHATDIAHHDGNREGKVVFVWDRTTRTTTRVVNTLNSLVPRVSADGALVAYSSGDLDMINGPPDVYLWDRLN